jgi:hypothetical protein
LACPPGTRKLAVLRVKTLGDLIDIGATGTQVVRDLASGNGGDGIDINVAATTLVRHTTTRNHDLASKRYLPPYRWRQPRRRLR